MVLQSRGRRSSRKHSYRPFPPTDRVMSWEEHGPFFARRKSLPAAEREQEDARFVSQNARLYWSAVHRGMRFLEGVESDRVEVESIVNGAFAAAIESYNHTNAEGVHFMSYFDACARNAFIAARRDHARWRTHTREPYLLDAMYPSSNSEPLKDMLQVEDRRTLFYHMGLVLDTREYLIVALSHGLGVQGLTSNGDALDNVQIAQVLGNTITKERVRQIKERALRKVRLSYERAALERECDGMLKGGI